MAKKVSLKIELTMTGFDDQVDFIKETLAEDLGFGLKHRDYEFEIEDVPDEEIDDFCHEIREENESF